MMQEMTIKLQFPDECAELLEHPQGVCMVLPMTADEVVHLGHVLNGIARHLAFNLKCLRTLRELTETKPESIEHIRDMLDKMIQPAGDANEIFDGARMLIGRAVISKNSKASGTLQ